MDSGSPVDYYEALQISVNAEPETVHRVYRLFAQRFHPDNKETGSESRFRVVTEAYRVLSDPRLRAQYDLAHERQQKERWRLVEHGADARKTATANAPIVLFMRSLLRNDPARQKPSRT